MHVTFSNRLELLFDAMSPLLYAHRPSPLGKILVVVPSLGMKNWIMHQAAATYQIAFGFEVVLLNDAIHKLSASSKTPNRVELALRIQEELDKLKEHPFQDLKSSAKKTEIALELAEVFLKYGEYAKGWEAASSHWQAELWKRVYTHFLPLSSLLEHFNLNLPLQVHLFGLSYLSDLKQDFFERLNQRIPVYFWVLSPSRMLWTDHKSKKEQVFIAASLEKRGIKWTHIQELQGYLEESHPLIGNNGRLGRKWREKMDDSCSSDLYAVIEHPTFEKFMLDGVKTYQAPLTLLEAIQADLTLLALPEEALSFSDRSIEIHSAPSRLREIEALYETLLRAASLEHIPPGEMLVLAPDFEKYIPFIKIVFGKEGSLLPYEVLECSEKDSPFFDLIAFAESRWDLDSLFTLLPQLNCSLKGDDLQIVKNLLIKAEVRWGIHLAHREKLCGGPLIDKSPKGTWEGGFEALIDQLIDGSLNSLEAELLNQFLDFFKQFYQDLKPIVEEETHSLLAWKEVCFHLIATYLPDEQEMLRILRKLQGEGLLGARSFFIYLKAFSSTKVPAIGVRNLQAVRFCPLLPMRAIPAEVIALLGMNSEVFPRIERKSPLFIAPTPYMPTATDYDRYLFLESLLAARKKWLLSYVETEKESPSCLVQEFSHYLEKLAPTYNAFHRHPDLPFDSRYFVKNSPFKSSSQAHFRAALVCRQQSPSRPLEIRPPLPSSLLNLELLPSHLTLRELKNLFYHPIRFYLNQVHGIYLQKEEFSHPDMEEFIEEKLWDSEWLKWALHYPIEKVVELAEMQGKLPVEPFKEASKERLRQNLTTWKELLAARGIALDAIFELEFSYDCQKIEQIGPALWKVPPIELNYRGKLVSITGVLPYVVEQGYLSLREFKKETLATMMPEMLAMQEVEGIASKMLFIKKNKEFAIQKLSWTVLLDHYVRSRQQPIPFHPTWIASLLSTEPVSLGDCPYHKWAFPKGEIDPSTLQAWKEEAALLFSPLLRGENEDI